MKIVLITHPSGEQLPILIDFEGLPIPAPNEFILSRRARSSNTLIRNARELSVLYFWLKHNKVDIWQRIKNAKGFTEAEVCGGMIETLRRDQSKSVKVKKIAVTPKTFNQRLITIRMYLSWCYDIVLGSLPFEDKKYERIRENKQTLINWLDGEFVNSPPSTGTELAKGLRQKQLYFLIKCFDPENSSAIAGSI